MKLELKPGVTPAYFWTSVGIGIGGTAATALSLTAYSWAVPLAGFLALLIGWLRTGGPKPPPGAALLVLALLCGSLVSCGSFTKQDAKAAGESIGLAAADAAIVIARMQLANAEAELALAATEPGADSRMVLAKQLGVMAAKKALDEAEKAIAKQRLKSAKNPVNVTAASSGHECPRSPPECLRRVAVPDYGPRVAAAFADSATPFPVTVHR